MVLKKIFNINSLIFGLLFISLGINAYILYDNYQIKEGLKAQLEMIDSVIDKQAEIVNMEGNTK